MKRDSDEDPQRTLTPGHAHSSPRIEDREGSSTAEPRGRRLKLGNPVRSAGAGASPRQTINIPEVSPATQRGFTIGREAPTNLPVTGTSKTKVQPWILFVAGGALLLLVVALLLRPASGGGGQSKANERLLAQYAKYLETKGPASGVDVAARQKDVIARLQAVEWAKAIGDKTTLENELMALMFLDNDKSSPIYQYSVVQLKQLGSGRRGAGL